MSLRLNHRTALLIALIILMAVMPIGLAVARSGHRQASELLANPGFEPPFDQEGSADIFVAAGWRAWYVVPGGATYPTDCSDNAPATCKPYRIPVYRNSQPQNARIPPRARSGNSQQWGAQYATYVAGVYQRVSGVTAGARLRFTAYVQGFNCDDDRGCFGPAGQYGYSYEPGNMQTRVGIDPTGGTDAFSANVVWSSFQNPLDAFSLHAVEAVAQGNAVTVFVWSSPAFPEKHTDIYVDDASLTVAGQGPAPQATAAPTQPGSTPQPAPTLSPGGTYTIQAGDTLFAIALRYNLTLDQLLALNPGLTRDTILQVGQVINVGGTPSVTTPQPTAQPSPTAAPTVSAPLSGGPITYTVKSGDTLSAIALQFNLTLDQLLVLNGVTKDVPIQVGQVLTVGVAAVTPTPTPTVTPTLAISTPVPTMTATPAVANSGLCLAAFDDQNGDTARDSGEALIEGVQFDVKDANGQSAATYTTDGVKEPHCINTLPAGRYTIEITLPPSRTATSDTRWLVSLLSDTTVNVAFGSRVLEATAVPGETPTPAPTVAADAAGRGSSAPLGLLLGGALILLAAAAFAFGVSARRRR